jgi:hypothetical protein
MPIKETLEEAREHYEKEIKPMIEEGSFQMAGFEFYNLKFGLYQDSREISRYHHGPSLLVSASALEKQLKENKKPELMLKFFETYLGQVQLAIKTNNRFY